MGDEEIPEARKQAVTPLLGVIHSLGLALLLVSERVRQVVDSLGANTRPPSELRSIAELGTSAADQWWYRAATDLNDAVSFGQPRAALWAAVFFALVVRLNKDGPAQVQRSLSYLTGCYCALAVVVGLPYAGAGGFVLLALGVGAGVTRLATRK